MKKSLSAKCQIRILRFKYIFFLNAVALPNQKDGIFAYIIHHSPTLADRKLDTVKERNGYLIVLLFAIQITHTLTEQRPHRTQSDITAVFSGSNN